MSDISKNWDFFVSNPGFQHSVQALKDKIKTATTDGPVDEWVLRVADLLIEDKTRKDLNNADKTMFYHWHKKILTESE